MSIISFEVDDQTAQAFAAAPAKDQKKLQLLLRLRLRELTSAPQRPLSEVMDEIASTATRNGLTPEMLDSLLNAN